MKKLKEGLKENIIIPIFFRNILYMTGEDHTAATELALTAS